MTFEVSQHLPPKQAADARRRRIGALDVVRGFALCGILLVTVPPIANIGNEVVVSAATSPHDLLRLLTAHRFFPIFSLLFGIGFALQMRSATTRSSRPRLILLRRLLVLLGIGIVHFLLWPGDILSTYAVIGLLVLLPSTWLPRLSTPVLAAVLVAAALFLGGDRLLIVAGLFMLGSALVRYGVVDKLESSTRVPLAVGLCFAAVAAPLLWAQVEADGTGRHFDHIDNAAGLALAGVYVCTLLVLLRTPLRQGLATVFAPLGRMALTNYLTATVLVWTASLLLGERLHTPTSGIVILVAVSVLTLQWTWSVLWLRRFRYGPVEWLWRWATWAQRPRLVNM